MIRKVSRELEELSKHLHLSVGLSGLQSGVLLKKLLLKSTTFGKE